MSELLIFKNDNSLEYPIRVAVKAVILDSENNILLFSNYLPGGGVEEGESLEEALKRECLEEVGAEIENIQELGTIVQYRDFIQKKYEMHGFLARFVSMNKATTKQEDEVNNKAHLMTISEAKEMLKERIQEMKSSPMEKDSEEYQSRYYHRMTSLAFIENAEQLLG